MIMCWLTRVATLLNSGCMLRASIRVTVIRPGIHKSAYVWRFAALAELLLPSMLSSWCSSRCILPHGVAPCVRPTLLLMWYWSLLVLLLSMLLLMWYEQGIELFRGLFCPWSCSEAFSAHLQMMCLSDCNEAIQFLLLALPDVILHLRRVYERPEASIPTIEKVGCDVPSSVDLHRSSWNRICLWKEIKSNKIN